MRTSGVSVPLESAALSVFTQRSFYRRFGKRILDVTLGLALLLIAAPVILGLALAVGVTSGFPPFYAATRVGKDGLPFRMWKLRSMVKGADAVLRRWRDEGTREGSAYAHSYKLRDDPRVTPLGRLLRKTSLDELPQLWNVVRGDMSLVGPRPIVLEELEKYGTESDLLLSVRPGVTGLWQVEGRNDIDYPRRAHVELDYVARVSLLEDVRLLVRTAPIVLLKRNGV
jgi:lipopolysaccharide/colanic/teichoic acid biosynthesis glycosyltransferase